MCRTTMHLYIQSSSFSTEVPEISLLDGHIPAIGALTPDPDTQGGIFPAIEPAVWFKVLVIDSVSIDCTKRAIHWNSSVFSIRDSDLEDSTAHESSIRREKRKRLSESMFVGGECYGYHNDLDELFDSAQHLLDCYVSSELSCKDFHRQIFTLLHCYVLPNIKLNTDDLHELGQALFKQEQLIRDCDQEILAKYGKLDEIEKAMYKLRLRFTEEVNKPSGHYVNYPPDLIKYLQKHIDADIRSTWNDIEKHNDGIQMLKAESDPESGNSSISSSSSSNEEPSNEKKITAQRSQRSKLLKTYESMISAREALYALANGGSTVQNPPPKKWTRRVKKVTRHKKKTSLPPNPLHNIYLELTRKWAEVEKDIQHSALKKVRLISVKEALRSTIEELRDNEETYGIDLDQTGSLRPTDILRQSKVPKQWQTLTEKVCRHLKKGGSVTKKYEDFKMQMLMRCQGLIEEYDKFELSETITDERKEPSALNPHFHTTSSVTPDISSCFTGAVTQASLPRSKFYREAHQSMLSLAASDVITATRDSTDFLFVFDKERDYLKKGLDKLRKDIQEHFSQMVSILLGKIGLNDRQVNMRKVWLCYESYFYESLMPPLCNVYQKAYSRNMLSLQEVLPMLTIRDLNLDDSLLIGLLETRDSISEDDEGEEEEVMPKSSGLSDSSFPDSSGSDDNNKESGSSRDNTSELKDCKVHCSVEMNDGNCDTHEKQLHRIAEEPPGASDCNENTMSRNYSGRCAMYFEEEPKSPEPLAHLSEITLNIKEDGDEELKAEGKNVELSSDYPQWAEHEKTTGDVFLRDSYREKRHGVLSSVYEPTPSLRLELLPSMSNMSDTSTSSESGSMDAFGSMENLKLLQEAEDIVAGLLPIKSAAASAAAGEANSKPEPCSNSEISTNDTNVLLRSQSEGDAKQNEGDLTVNQQLPSIMKQIKVHHPTSVTLVYHRCTWPIPHAAHTYKHLDDSVECGDEAVKLDSNNQPTSERTSRPRCRRHLKSSVRLRHTSVYFKTDYRGRFSEAMECLNNVITETAPLLKLQSLTSCLRRLNQQLTTIQQEMDHSMVTGASTDNLIDMLVLLLCNYDPVLACRLYPQIVLLSDVMAPFFEGGPYNFSLVQFCVAFQFLQEKMVMKQSIAENAQCRQRYEAEMESSA